MTDPFALDRLVADAARELRFERERFRSFEGALEGPAHLSRSISSKSTLDALLEQDARAPSPLVTALIEWVRYLAVLRVTEHDRAALAASLFGNQQRFTEIVRGLLLPLANTPVIEQELCDAALRSHDALRRHHERVEEAKKRLHVSATTEGLALAEGVLSITESAFDFSEARSWSEPLRRALASNAAEGWPVHLNQRWLATLFKHGELVRGVKLEEVTLPTPLGAASFARGLSSFGDALAFGDRPSGTPFCLVRTPRDPLLARRACLFAALTLEPSFHRKKLGIGRVFAAEQTRRVAHAAVIWLRFGALRVLSQPLLSSARGQRDFEELSERVLGRALPGALLGLLPCVGPEDSVRLESVADACAERVRLREQFDEDWFDNPRAHEALRHENHLPVFNRPSLWPTEVASETFIGEAPREQNEPSEASAGVIATGARLTVLAKRLDEALGH